MSSPFPPLGSLRAFEAVARRLSFSRAAEELNVTPGAVSQQIGMLEKLLGQTLFVRTKRSVALSEAAARMLPEIQSGLETLARAVRNTVVPAGSGTLTISVAPSFASKWLMPRLSDFTEKYPDIDLRVSATVALADLARDNVDLAIRLGHGPYRDVRAEPLFGEGLTPLCSPELLRRKGRLRTPDDLRRHKLIHDTSIPGENEQSSWRRWLDFAGAKAVSHHRGIRFSLAELAMQAAIDGAGVVLARVVLAENDIRTGRLVRPFDIVLPLDVTYFLVLPRHSAPRREVSCFRAWMAEQSRRRVSKRPKRRSL
jgi:LysR family glycine cleavage system transcriptional activator